MSNLHLEHHDRDDNSDYAIAERGHSFFIHQAPLFTGNLNSGAALMKPIMVFLYSAIMLWRAGRWQILLQKSFCEAGLKFSGPQVRRLNLDAGDHVAKRQTHRRFW
jgi:hypothetical protein